MTGVTGFVGSHLARRLAEEGAVVVGLAHDSKPYSLFNLFGLDRKVSIVWGDLSNFSFERVLAKYEIEYVFHLAAQAIVRHAYLSPLSTFYSNIIGTCNLLEACRKIGNIKAILVPSTDKVYGEARGRIPLKEDYTLEALGMYESSKACADLITRAYHTTYGIPVTVSRACNIFGLDLNPRIIPNTIIKCLKGIQPVIFKRIESSREYIYIDDVLDAYLLLIEKIDLTKGKPYNVGTGFVLTQEDIVLKIISHFKDLQPKYEEPPPHMEKEIQEELLSSERISRIGWSPKVSIDHGLSKTIDDFNKYWHLLKHWPCTKR